MAIPLTAAAIRWGTRVPGYWVQRVGISTRRRPGCRIPGYPGTPVPGYLLRVTSMHTREPGYNCTRVPPGARIPPRNSGYPVLVLTVRGTRVRVPGTRVPRVPGYCARDGRSAASRRVLYAAARKC
eukprot:711811-Rhodomonas_salina.1